jgi:cobalt-precorrin 5A hydrolase
MKIAVISFNSRGEIIAEKLQSAFSIDVYSKREGESFNITELAGKLMKEYKQIIFISSVGIAVRAIAPFIKSKDIDPAVLVVDSFGRFVISVLSGHLGGANELTLKVAEVLGAEPIITTATDYLGVAAPDIIAKDNGLMIDSLKDAKDIAALLLDNKKVAFLDEDSRIKVPKGYTDSLEEAHGVVCVTNKIDTKLQSEKDIKKLKLIRRNIILGIGCRKDYPPEKMQEIVLQKLLDYKIDFRAVKTVASVEVKKDETAVIELAEFLKAEFKVFTIEEIKKIQHNYEGSSFVEKTIGVRAVCEPCVELSGGQLLSGKISCEGMTLCIGKEAY